MYTVYQRVVGGKNREFTEPLNEESGGRRKCKERHETYLRMETLKRRKRERKKERKKEK